jgi:hypothetical protein
MLKILQTVWLQSTSLNLPVLLKFFLWHELARLLLYQRSMHKTYFYLIAMLLPVAAIVARTIAKLKVEVPVGYQDENGFHAGTGRAENKLNWPPFW